MIRRTAKGRPIDIEALRAANPNTIAVGSIGSSQMTARGDIVQNGRIVKTREQINAEQQAILARANSINLGMNQIDGKGISGSTNNNAGTAEAFKRLHQANTIAAQHINTKIGGSAPRPGKLEDVSLSDLADKIPSQFKKRKYKPS